MIKGWGLGVNSPEPILKLMDVADANVCLLARQYSLIDHENAVRQVFPKARERGMAFVVGSSLNAGFISGSARFNYGKDNYKIPRGVIEKRARLREVAARYGVDLRTAALKFSDCAGRRGRARRRLLESAAGARGLHVAQDEHPSCVLVGSSV